MARDDDRFIIRLPGDMRPRLKAIAFSNGRSMNAEIVHRLHQSFTTATALDSSIAALIEQHVRDEIDARLRRIAAQIGGE